MSPSRIRKPLAPRGRAPRQNGGSMKRFTRPEAMVFLSWRPSERPMHFSAMQLFRPPQGSVLISRETPSRQCGLIETSRRLTPGIPQRLAAEHRGCAGPMTMTIDIDYHLRYTTLPAPGGLRELLALGDELHAPPLDRHKPLWECHVIDGLNDGRFALFYKVHHALMDGMSWANQMHAALSTDPDDSRVRVGWTRQPESPQSALPARTRQERPVRRRNSWRTSAVPSR